METPILAIAIAMLAAAERRPDLRYEPLALLRPWFATDAFCLATGGVALSGVMRSWAAGRSGVLGFSALDPASLPAPAGFLVGLVLYDLGAYLTHWLLHRFEPLWKLHKVHHSSLRLDWLATFRAHVLEHALRHLLSPVALLLLGFPPAVVGLVAVAYTAWAALNHANLRLPLRGLEPILITPRLHRMHHVPATSERNLGTIFSLWDRLRGTLVDDPEARLDPIGVPGEIASYPQSWPRQLVEPFRRGRWYR